jgi:hypothetical protein
MLILLAWLWFCALFAPVVRAAFEQHNDTAGVERESESGCTWCTAGDQNLVRCATP